MQMLASSIANSTHVQRVTGGRVVVSAYRRVGETAKVRVERWPAPGRQKAVEGHDEVVTLRLGEAGSGFVSFEAFFGGWWKGWAAGFFDRAERDRGDGSFDSGKFSDLCQQVTKAL